MGETESRDGHAVESATAPNQPTDQGSDEMAKPDPTKAPAFQFYPNDFLGSTKVQLMTTTEIGAYWLLICACWLDGSVPNDMRRLAAIARMKEQPFVKMWNHVLHECFIARGDVLIQVRLEIERKKQHAYRKQQKEKADKRWQSHGNATAMPRDGTRHPLGNALYSSSSSSFASSSSKEQELDKAFADFQEAYPAQRRKGGYLVQQQFLAAVSNAGGADKLMDALDNHKQSEQWALGKIPGMDVWLNEERWRQTLPSATFADKTVKMMKGAAEFIASGDRDGSH